LSAPKIVAASSFAPIASTIRGRTSSQIGTCASSRYASGIGTITASSSATSDTFFQSTALVCFIPASPLTQ
jgi:hypothetical protein